MTCKCGYQNHADANYCGGCGRKLHHSEGIRKKWLAIAAVCLLITGIGIGNLLSRLGTPDSAMAQQGNLKDLIVKNDVEIAQVLPLEDGSVAVRYSDGTVRVSENSPLYGTVSGWNDVEQLYCYVTYEWTDGEMLEYPTLFGLTKRGSVLSTDGKTPGWSNIKELLFSWQGIVGVTNDGKVLTHGEWEDPSFLTNLTEVETLVNNGETWGCLKKDGSVKFVSADLYEDSNPTHWRNVKELRASDHGFYAIMKDGTLEGQFDDTYAGLRDAVKVVDFEDWIFGISKDGRLLTHSGGNIYTNLGDMMVDVPGLPYYGEEVDIHRFDRVRDIVPFWGLIVLNEDGTAEHIGEYPHWDLGDWNDVQKICGCDSGESTTNLYGIQRDGSVVMNRYDWYQDEQIVTTQYRGWKLQDIYAGNEGIVGLTTDGKMVGDGIYENVDFSVFDR